MATEDISIRVKIDDVKKKLAELPNLTKKEFTALVTNAEQTLKKLPKAVQKEAEAAARATERAAKEAAAAQERAFNDVKKGATVAFGGIVGDIEDVAGAMKSLVVQLGPVGAGLAAAGIALVALPGATALAVAGFVKLVEVANDAIEGVQKLGGAKIVTDDQIKAVQQAADTIDFFKSLISQAAIVLVADLGPNIDSMIVKLGTFTLNTIKSLSTVLQYFDAVQLGATMLAAGIVELTIKIAALANPLGLMAVAALKVAEALTGTDQGLEQLNEQLKQYAWNTAKSVTGLGQQAKATGELTDEQKSLKKQLDEYLDRAQAERVAQEKAKAAKEAAAKAAKENAAALKAEKEAAEALTRTFESLSEIEAQANSDQQTALDKLGAWYSEQMARIDKLGEKEGVTADARKAVNERFYRELAKLEKDRGTQAATQIQKQQEMELAANNARLQAAKDLQAAIDEEIQAERAAYEKLYGTILGVLGPIGDLGRALGDLSKQQLEAIGDERKALRDKIAEATGYEKIRLQQRLDALNDEAEGYRKLQMVAFRVRKGIAISEAIVNGAVAATRALAELGPVAGGIAAAVIATTTAAQVALISSERPKFHTGLDPSEMPAVITRGEGVANVRAMSQPGFAETLRAANAGLPAQSSGPVVIALNDRILAQLDARTQRVRGRVAGGNVVRLGTATHYG